MEEGVFFGLSLTALFSLFKDVNLTHTAERRGLLDTAMCKEGPPLYLYCLLECEDAAVRSSVLWVLAYFGNYSSGLSDNERRVLLTSLG
jgi:hypothetical protein